MDYGFDEDQEAFRAELRRWADKMLAPHYQPDDKAAEFRSGIGCCGSRSCAGD